MPKVKTKRYPTKMEKERVARRSAKRGQRRLLGSGLAGSAAHEVLKRKAYLDSL